MKKVIISDCDHKDINIESKILNDSDIKFELKQCISEEDVINNCKEATVIINQYAPVTRKVMESLNNLKMVVRYGVGVNNIDVAAATELGIQICNVPDYGVNEVSDHAIALMLTLTRKIVLMNSYTKNEKWDYIKSIPIRRYSTLNVGVIGLGRIGFKFAKKAHDLGFNIMGYDPFFKKTEENEFIVSATIDEIVEKADIISIHCPLENNENLFNKETFKKMKNSAFIINVSRGGIINEKDLDEALTNKEIAGAALDCLEKEPTNPGAPLFKHNNVIVTPHMAWYSEEASQELKRKVAEESVRFIKGEKVNYPVNKLVEVN